MLIVWLYYTTVPCLPIERNIVINNKQSLWLLVYNDTSHALSCQMTILYITVISLKTIMYRVDSRNVSMEVGGCLSCKILKAKKGFLTKLRNNTHIFYIKRHIIIYFRARKLSHGNSWIIPSHLK